MGRLASSHPPLRRTESMSTGWRVAQAKQAAWCFAASALTMHTPLNSKRVLTTAIVCGGCFHRREWHLQLPGALQEVRHARAIKQQACARHKSDCLARKRERLGYASGALVPRQRP